MRCRKLIRKLRILEKWKKRDKKSRKRLRKIKKSKLKLNSC